MIVVKKRKYNDLSLNSCDDKFMNLINLYSNIDNKKYKKYVTKNKIDDVVDEFNNKLLTTEDNILDDDILAHIYSSLKISIDKRLKKVENKKKDKVILSFLNKYGISVVDKDIGNYYEVKDYNDDEEEDHDCDVSGNCNHENDFVVERVNITGIGCSYNKIDPKPDHLNSISFSDITYHENDIVQYLSFLFSFNGELYKRLIYNIEFKNDEGLEMCHKKGDLCYYKVATFIYIRLKPTSRQKLDSNSNCLIYYDNNVYHVNRGKYYSFERANTNWYNMYLDDENDKGYKWVIKDGDKGWKETNNKDNSCLMHGPLVFSKYEGILPFGKLYKPRKLLDKQYVIFKDFK